MKQFPFARYLFLFVSLFIYVGAEPKPFSGAYHEEMLKMQAFKSSLQHRASKAIGSGVARSHVLFPLPSPLGRSERVYNVISYGADPTGTTDSTEALLKAFSDAAKGPSDGVLTPGITNLGGAQIHLQGGIYLISKPLRFPVAAIGNVVITGGTIRASEDFPTNEYLINISATSVQAAYSYELITFRDLMLDCSYRGGGISIVNSLRMLIDNCFVAHFGTNGVYVESGHETYIRNSFFGQHITIGGDPGERNFTGTGINLAGNDNAVTDTIVFSAAVGIMLSGQANLLTGVHCYNKATPFGGVGIYVKLPGFTQTRIVNSYLDFTGIVAEDPVQLTVSNCFFLGDAYVLLKSVKGMINGLNIIDNQFAGTNTGIEVVQLDQSNGTFKQISQMVVDRNMAYGMNLKSTVARGSATGNGTSWAVDFRSRLLFPNQINQVQYTMKTDENVFPNHALRGVSNNTVVVETDAPLSATVYVTVDQFA